MGGAGPPPTPHPAAEGCAPDPMFVSVFLHYLPKMKIWIKIILEMCELIATRDNTTKINLHTKVSTNRVEILTHISSQIHTRIFSKIEKWEKSENCKI